MSSRVARRWFRSHERLVGFPGWHELAEDGSSLRQIERRQNVWDIFSWYGWRPDCCCLADQVLDEAELSQVIAEGDLWAVSRDEFQEAWDAALASRRAEWKALQERVPPGATRMGQSLIFYPHGVLVGIGESFNAILPFEAYRDHFAGQIPGARRTLPVVLETYDDDFQWIRARATTPPHL